MTTYFLVIIQCDRCQRTFEARSQLMPGRRYGPPSPLRPADAAGWMIDGSYLAYGTTVHRAVDRLLGRW